MTDLATTIDIQPNEDTEILVDAGHPPTLITEQEVLIGSAAALAGPKVRSHRVRNALRVLFWSGAKADTSEMRKTPKHYPRHHDFIETAAMSRMMDRL